MGANDDYRTGTPEDFRVTTSSTTRHRTDPLRRSGEALRSRRARFSGVPSSVRIAILAVAISALSTGSSADCGDDIDGRNEGAGSDRSRVACECGDIVVSDMRLQPADPILRAPCVGDGLLVRPPLDGSALVIDLNGQEIVGTGVGSGIRVLPGGSGGVVIVGGVGGVQGTLTGFRDGIRALADGALSRVIDVTVRGSTGTGIRVRGEGIRLEGVRVEDNGRDGVRTSGRGVDLVDVETERNARRGVAHHARGGEARLESRGNAIPDRLDGTRSRTAGAVEDSEKALR
jgi:hypothetical protein